MRPRETADPPFAVFLAAGPDLSSAASLADLIQDTGARPPRTTRRFTGRRIGVLWQAAANGGDSMKRTICALVIGASLAAGAAQAEQRIEINNTYPITQESFQLADRVFYTQDNRGYFEVIEGPFTEGPARCIGSGFGLQDGRSTVTGICIFGEGEETFTIVWEAGQQGAANSWTVVDGTGRYRGMTGSGIATTNIATMYKALPLRETHIVGTVQLREPD